MKKFLLLVVLLTGFSTFAQNPDINLLRAINHGRNPGLDNTFRFFDDATAPVAIATPLILFGYSFIAKDTAARYDSFYAGATLASAAIVTTVLKYSVNRSRPFQKYPDIIKAASAGSPSFPSGHTSDAFAFATSLSILYPRWYVIIPAYSWASVIGFSRMDLGVHYPTDVLAGAVIGAGTAWLCYKGRQYIFHHRKNR